MLYCKKRGGKAPPLFAFCHFFSAVRSLDSRAHQQGLGLLVMFLFFLLLMLA